jgi:hypothetical protein
MYCPVCGAESTQGLNYCKRCGVNLLSNTASQQPSSWANSIKTLGLFMSTALVAVVGLVGMFVTASELSEPHRNMPPQFLTGILFVIGAAVLGIIWSLISLLTKLMGVPGHQVSRPMTGDVAPPQIAAPSASMRVPSVTEHTTRNFELPREREPGQKVTR